jgi:hypothetical protein
VEEIYRLVWFGVAINIRSKPRLKGDRDRTAADRFGRDRHSRPWLTVGTSVRGFRGNESEIAGTGRGGKAVLLGDQEPIGRNIKNAVMVDCARCTLQSVPPPFDQQLFLGVRFGFNGGASAGRFIASYHRDHPMFVAPPQNQRWSFSCFLQGEQGRVFCQALSLPMSLYSHCIAQF